MPLLRQTISDYASTLHNTDIGIDRITVSGSGMNAIMMVSEALMSADINASDTIMIAFIPDPDTVILSIPISVL